MKSTNTITSTWPIARMQLQAMQLELESRPDGWHQSLQKTIDQGAFIKLEFGIGSAGLIDGRALLVSRTGQMIELTAVE